MDIRYRINEDYSWEDVVLDGETEEYGYVTSVDEALQIVKIENPAIRFANCVKMGDYNDYDDDEYDIILDMVRFISSLWKRNDSADDKPARQIGLLPFLAKLMEKLTVTYRQLCICKTEKEYWKQRAAQYGDPEALDEP